LLTATARANSFEYRKAFAQELSKNIARAGLRKIYFSDLTDPSGEKAVLGRIFAASFSKLVSEKAKKTLTVISRIEVNRYLAKNGLTDHDLSTADVRTKLASDFGLDAILGGTVSVNQDIASIELISRDPSGKELFRSRYEEMLDTTLTQDFDVGQSGTDFYIAGVDGVTVPKCLSCPAPSYSLAAKTGIVGMVNLWILVTVEGKVGEIRLVKKLAPNLDRMAVDAVQSWRFVPSKDPNGKPVPARISVEIAFHN
jgi:TonB family protein